MMLIPRRGFLLLLLALVLRGEGIVKQQRQQKEKEKIVALVIFLEDIEDSAPNREVLEWASTLIQANILVEFMTAERNISLHSSHSSFLKRLLRTNCVLRSISTALGATAEIQTRRQIARYVQKFDLALAVAPCTLGGQHEGKLRRSCWNRVIEFLSLAERTQNLQASYSANSSVNSMFKGTTRRVLYVPQELETELCHKDSHINGLFEFSNALKHVDVLMSRVSMLSHCLMNFQKDQLFDSDLATLVVVNVEIRQGSIYVSDWQLWFLKDDFNYQSLDKDIIDSENECIFRILALDIFQDKSSSIASSDAHEVYKEFLEVEPVESMDLPVAQTPLLGLGVEPQKLNVMVIDTASYANPVIYSYLSRAFPYHQINIRVFSFENQRVFFDKGPLSDGVYHNSNQDNLSSLHILVWMYGYETFDPQTNQDDMASQYVTTIYRQFLQYFNNPNLCLLFLSGEALQYSIYFGNTSHLPKAIISSTISPEVKVKQHATNSEEEYFITVPSKAGVMFLNTVHDPSYFPESDARLHCPEQRHWCRPMQYMFHLSVAATSLFESFDPFDPYHPKHPASDEPSKMNPVDLLSPRGMPWAKAQLLSKSVSKSVAYLYHRCDRPEREQFFRLLLREELGMRGRVHALGRCNGNLVNQPNFVADDLASRDDGAFTHSAIQHYQSYKFVIAFENLFLKGYITEKLLNAYFAGAIPIYLGPPDVNEYFRSESMINCQDFQSLEECAQFVAQVDRDDELYLSILREPPMVNLSMWCTLFSWHPLTLQACPLQETYHLPLAMRRNLRSPHFV